jgi:hypothetical protein
VSSRIAAAEPSIGHASEPRACARSFNCAGQRGRASRAVVRADIEVRQGPCEQAGDVRPDGMAVIQHDVCMLGAQPGNGFGERSVIGIKKRAAPHGDLRAIRSKPLSIKRLPIECGRRAQLCRCLPGIQRNAGRIAIAIDDRARDGGADDCRTHCVRKVIQQIDPPIRVFAGQPG